MPDGALSQRTDPAVISSPTTDVRKSRGSGSIRQSQKSGGNGPGMVAGPGLSFAKRHRRFARCAARDVVRMQQVAWKCYACHIPAWCALPADRHKTIHRISVIVG